MESQPDFLALGPDAVLYAILDQVVDEYEPVAAGLENDIDEIEDDLFSGDPDVSRRIYELSRQVIMFQRGTSPLAGILQALLTGTAEHRPGPELQDHLRDVLDHVLRLGERTASFRALLQNALTVNAALVAQRQNDEMRRLTESSFAQSEQVKRISSWAAILFAPTLVGTIYGMNFRTMPELDWIFGYPMALGLMAAMGVALYAAFKHNKWI
jgi:magnesium transporter